MEIFDFLLAIISGIISSILIVGYTYSENERSELNLHINYLFDEIAYNRKKLPNYSKYLSEVKNDWEQNNNLKWINNNVISTGYGDYLYNFFKFDAYNLFTNSGLNLSLDSDLDYNLKLFYYNSKQFCANTQKIEEQIRIDLNNNLKQLVSIRFNAIRKEFDDITTVFNDHIIFSGENKEKFQISWIDWHIKRIRISSGCKMETPLSRFKKILMPYGQESGECWIWAGTGVVLIGAGSFMLLNGGPFASHPTVFSIINSSGFFLMSLGLAFLLFAINRHSSIGTKKQLEKMTEVLEEINKNTKK
jgi:hypothetical protein